MCLVGAYCHYFQRGKCVFSAYWLGLCILLPYDGGYTYFLFMECVANGCLVENYSTILFFCRISFSYVLCFRSFWHPFYYIIFLNSLTTIKFFIATCAVCIKIIVIINEKYESAKVLIQNSKFPLFSFNQFLHHLLLLSNIEWVSA